MPDPNQNHRSPRQGPLLAVSAAAVLAVYSAGWFRTREAAAAIADAEGGRRRSRTAVAPKNGATIDALATTTSPVTAGAHDSSRGTDGPAPAPQSGIRPVGTADMGGTTRGSSAATPANIPGPALAPTEAPASTPAPASTAATAAPAATAPAAAPVTPPAPPAPPASDSASGPLHDGTFIGWGSSRHGDIEATVVIEGGKITAASISRCLTRYSCSWIAHLQGQVVTRQSPDVDNVSGATQSADAFYFAVMEALKKAR